MFDYKGSVVTGRLTGVGLYGIYAGSAGALFEPFPEGSQGSPLSFRVDTDTAIWLVFDIAGQTKPARFVICGVPEADTLDVAADDGEKSRLVRIAGTVGIA